MISLLTILALGFFIGMRHATDPDHVIAVSTIVARYRKVGQAAWIGVFWGLGHSITVFVVGTAVVLLGWTIPERVGLSMEFSVGLMLILLGALNLRAFWVWLKRDARATTRVTEDDDLALQPPAKQHTHPHPHEAGAKTLRWADRQFGQRGIYQVLRPLVVGVVHGMAGSSAVALLVLATIRDTQWALLYLLMFGAGTIVGMVLVTAAMALPMVYAGGRFASVNRALAVVSGVASVGFGIFLAYRVGFLEGLLR